MFTVRALTNEEITAIGTTSGKVETFPGVIYDTQTWLLAGVPAGLQFFQDAQTSAGLAKANVFGGRLPKGFNFLVQAFNITPMVSPTFKANNQTGILDDLEKFLKSNQSYFVWSKNDKPWKAIPTTYAHAAGGATGFMAASYTAPQVMQYANNGVFDGGFPTDDSLMILDQEPFSVTIAGIQPAVALTNDLVLQMQLRGVWYRPVA